MRSKNVEQNYGMTSLCANLLLLPKLADVSEIHNKENTTISNIAPISSYMCQPCKMADTYTIFATQSGVTNPQARYSLAFRLPTVLDLKLFSRRLP